VVSADSGVIKVGYSTRLGAVSAAERALLDIPGIATLELDLLTEDQLLENTVGVHYLVVGAVEPVNRKVIEAMDGVRLIVRRGTGMNNVDIDAATEFGIGVANVPDASVEEVSDHALALVLGLARRITASDRAIRRGEAAAARAAMESAPRISLMTMGVIGLGRIGSRFAEKASHLFGDVWGFDPATTSQSRIRHASFEEVLAAADAVSVHVPLAPGTLRMFNRRAFGLMKLGALFVNTSRGELVDEVALTEALASGQIAGAGLDVLADDPPKPDNPLLNDDRVVVTDHTAGRGRHASFDLRRRSVEAVVAAIEGKLPTNLLNPEVWPIGPRGTAPGSDNPS